MIAAVSNPSVRKETAFKMNARASFCIKEVPSNKLVIQIGRVLSIKRVASPNVKTTIRDDFLFSLSSSIYVIISTTYRSIYRDVLGLCPQLVVHQNIRYRCLFSSNHIPKYHKNIRDRCRYNRCTFLDKDDFLHLHNLLLC